MLVQFYHLTSTNLERTLPNLTHKIFDAGHTICIKLANKEALKEIDNLLWSYDEASFLPHSTGSSDIKSEEQKIYLTSEPEDISNNPEILIITDGTIPKKIDGIKKILDIFDGNNADELQSARNRWKEYKESELELTYWQQKQGGGWEKAA